MTAAARIRNPSYERESKTLTELLVSSPGVSPKRHNREGGFSDLIFDL
jgi:hypothetical protein